MNAKIYPSSIQGEISVPSSKSHTIRALIIATLAGGRSYIRNPLLSDDCKAAMEMPCSCLPPWMIRSPEVSSF